jgi:hypothetical protein
MRMTKAEALAEFKELWREALASNPRLHGDTVAKCEAWNDYTDALLKEGRISARAYSTWINPF